MNKTVLISTVCLSTSLTALDIKPWMPEPYIPELFLQYTYSEYSHVANASHGLHGTSHDQLIVPGIGIVTLSQWELDADAEFAHTPRFDWGVRSVGAQLRKQFLNDIAGDFMSLTMGFQGRVVPSKKALQDVSTPYHYHFNGELSASVGKEWSRDAYWQWRFFNFLGVGIANRGSPWVRDIFSIGFNREEEFQFDFFAAYYRGFGNQIEVNTSTSVFNGWKNFDHRSIDVGVAFRFFFGLWGSLKLQFDRRVYARSFPEEVNFFTLRYDLPLSI